MFILESAYNGIYDFYTDWIFIGLTKIFVIIAVLQVVKKIPDIINTIFGTHIQSRGGIKGRLGEMAAVGGLAQKAWTSLGTGAKNLAKLGLAAPLAAAGLGANKIYKDKHGGKSLTDTEAFRKGKGALYAARSAIKSGSVLNAYKEYEKMSEPTSHSRQQLMDIRSRAIKDLNNNNTGVSSQGTWTNEKKDTHGNVMRKTDGTIDYNSRADTLNQIKNVQSTYKGAFSDTDNGRKLIESMNNGIIAQRKYNDILGVQSSGEKVAAFAKSVSDTLSSNPSQYTANEISKANEIASRIEKGNRIVTADDANFLKQYMDTTTAEQFGVTVKKYDNALQTALDSNSEFTLKDLTSVGSLGGVVNNTKAAMDDAIAEQKDIVDKMSDADKVLYQTYSSVIAAQTNSLGVTNQFNDDAPTGSDQSWADGFDVTGAGSGIKSSAGGPIIDSSSSDSSKSKLSLSESESELFDEIISNGINPTDPEFATMAGSSANKFKDYYSSKLYDKLSDEEKELISDAQSEGISLGDPEFEQMRRDRSLNGKNITDYLKWKK